MKRIRNYRTHASTQAKSMVLVIAASIGLILTLGGFTLWHAESNPSPAGRTGAQILASAPGYSKGVAPASKRGIDGIPVHGTQHVALTNSKGEAAGTGVAAFTAQDAITWAIANPSSIFTPTSKVTP